MYIIAGLGNPGLKYHHTRHNAGFETIDRLAEEWRIPIRKKEFQSKTGTGVIDGKKVILVKPETYMNNSGEAIGEIARYYHADPESEVLIFCDDIMQDCGRLRIREKGSDGGHNGLKSIIRCLGTEKFLRIRVGVGRLAPGGDMIAHVLGRPSREDRKKIGKAEQDACEAVPLLLEGRIGDAKNQFNGIRETAE